MLRYLQLFIFILASQSVCYSQQWTERIEFQKARKSFSLTDAEFKRLSLSRSQLSELIEQNKVPNNYLSVIDTVSQDKVYHLYYRRKKQVYEMLALKAGQHYELFSIGDATGLFHVQQVTDTADVTGDQVKEILVILSSYNTALSDRSLLQVWDPIQQKKILESRSGHGGRGLNQCTGVYKEYANFLEFSFYAGGFSFEEKTYIREDQESRELKQEGLHYLYTPDAFVLDRTKICCQLYGQIDGFSFEALRKEYQQRQQEKREQGLCCPARLRSLIAELATRGSATDASREQIKELMGEPEKITKDIPGPLKFLPQYQEPIEVWQYFISEKESYYKIFSEEKLVQSSFYARTD